MLDKINTASAGSLKLLTWREKLDAWQAGEAFVPVGLEIHPSEQCNHNCPDCQAHYAIGMKKTRIRAMAGEHLDLSLLDSVWKNPPPGIVLSGNTGDPLMHPEFGKLLATIRERAAESKVLLITNGQKFSYETMTEALRTCQAIRISLDADGPAMYRVTHGTKADWGQTLANVIALRFLRDEVGSDCRIGIGYLTDRRTEPGMLAATKLARELGADSIQFRPFHHRATPVDSLIEDCRQYETDDFKVLVSWQKYDAAEDYQRTYTTCQGAHFVYLLDARGDFYICCHHVGNLAARLGSLRESTWQQFIQSQTRRESIEEFNVSDCVPLCRLDSQNVVLHQLQETYHVPEVTLPNGAKEQRCFL